MADLTSNQICNICCIHYNAGLRCCALGTDLTSTHGGWLFAKEGSVAWIVAPAATQVSRTWYARNDAVTCANNAFTSGDWFIPSMDDLLLANACREFWDTALSLNTYVLYWSSTSYTTNTCSWGVCFSNCANILNAGRFFTFRNNTASARAFRKVFY